jgi:predicted O-linked N-acetylglucosamine transferase (SPINDLY family)
LDTYPYNCGSTTNDVINAGVPIVTISGKTMVSRMGGSILNAIGVYFLVCVNYLEYTKIVIFLYRNKYLEIQWNIINKYNQHSIKNTKKTKIDKIIIGEVI